GATLAVAGTALASAGGGAPRVATLTGAAERPGPGDPDGSGSAVIRVNVGQKRVCWQLSVAGIGPLPAAAAHIHAGTKDTFGGVVVTLGAPDASGKASGCTTVSDKALLKALIQTPESYYVNVHTGEWPSGALAVDGGAHLGHVALTMARAGAEVLAYEPQPAILPALRANVARNGLQAQVSVRAAALGSGRGEAFLSSEGSSSTLAGGRGTRVDVVSLDDDLAGRVPTVVKLDLEGWEVEALRGMRRTLEGDVVLLVECNPEALGAAGTSQAELVAELALHGYDVRRVDEKSRRLAPLSEPSGSGFANLVCARPETIDRLGLVTVREPA
ncbi:MAG: FkbM family methyltransferase, partial [Actinobacteria bacterium]|nr:FkbM family methyltransferase [Actinomycetota bacterium]